MGKGASLSHSLCFRCKLKPHTDWVNTLCIDADDTAVVCFLMDHTNSFREIKHESQLGGHTHPESSVRTQECLNASCGTLHKAEICSWWYYSCPSGFIWKYLYLCVCVRRNPCEARVCGVVRSADPCSVSLQAPHELITWQLSLTRIKRSLCMCKHTLWLFFRPAADPKFFFSGSRLLVQAS